MSPKWPGAPMPVGLMHRTTGQTGRTNCQWGIPALQEGCWGRAPQPSAPALPTASNASRGFPTASGGSCDDSASWDGSTWNGRVSGAAWNASVESEDRGLLSPKNSDECVRDFNGCVEFSENRDRA